MKMRTNKAKIKFFCRLFHLTGLGLLMMAFSFFPHPWPAKEALAAAASSQEWDELIRQAKKEGTVSIYATAIQPAVLPLRNAFKAKYGIDLEFVQGRPAEVVAKLGSERSAGLSLADVGHLGETTSTMDIKPMKVTQPLPNLLLSSDINNPRNWINGSLPLLDKENHVLMFTAMAIPHGVVSSELVKENELVSFADLLEPKWKGKIVLSDPSISGTSPNLLAAHYKAFGEQKALADFKKLAAQEPVITRDQRLMMEWVARGKYLVGLGQSTALFAEFKRAQAPVRLLSLREPRQISGGPGNLVVFSNNPHPKAAQLYVNWLLSKEGLTIWSKALGYPATRVDVGQEWLDPMTIPRTTDVFPDEEHMKLRVKMRKIAAEIFLPPVK